MINETGEVKAGTALVFSSGTYSDYGFGQVYIAACDFNYLEEAKKCYFEQAEKKLKKENHLGWLDVGTFEFESYLVRNGFLALCQNQEIHVGDYGFFDEDIWEEEFKKMKGIV